MLRDALKTRCAIALVATIAAVSIVVQHRAIRQLRHENVLLRGQLKGLAGLQKENEALSTRFVLANATQPPLLPEAPRLFDDRTVQTLRAAFEIFSTPPRGMSAWNGIEAAERVNLQQMQRYQQQMLRRVDMRSVEEIAVRQR